jgi:hypothetical protein
LRLLERTLRVTRTDTVSGTTGLYRAGVPTLLTRNLVLLVRLGTLNAKTPPAPVAIGAPTLV